MKNSGKNSCMKLAIGAAVCLYSGFLFSQYVSQKWPPEDSNIATADSRVGSAATSNVILNKVEESAANFESTIRSCLGPNCFDEKVQLPDGSAVDRVGLLAPLNSGGHEIFTLLQNLKEKPKSKSQSIILIYETHVPAYGYGKNHGWSRIIRLTRKVVPHALSLSVGLNLKDDVGDGQNSALSAAVDIQTRQLVRWHCRLNHVAAHTKLLTVFVEDLIDKPAAILEMMLTFIGFKFSRPALLLAVPEFVSQLKNSMSFSNSEFLSPSSATAEKSATVGVETSMLLNVPEAYLKISASAITNEIMNTDGLTRWPCESFRKIKPYGKAETLELRSKYALVKERLRMSPSMLAANCSCPFVTCSVSFDTAGG